MREVEDQHVAVDCEPLEKPLQSRSVRLEIVLRYRRPSPSVYGLNRISSIGGLDERAAIDVYFFNNALEEAIQWCH